MTSVRRCRRQRRTVSVLRSRDAEISRNMQRTGYRFFPMLGSDLDSVGGNEFGIGHADEAEHPAQISFQMFADGGRCAGAVISAARDRDDDALVARQALNALGRI